MRPKTFTVDNDNSPKYVPVDWRGGDIAINATPSSATYSVAYTLEDAKVASAVTNWVNVTGMASATSAAAKELSMATCLRITCSTSGSVAVDVAQSDV